MGTWKTNMTMETLPFEDVCISHGQFPTRLLDSGCDGRQKPKVSQKNQDGLQLLSCCIFTTNCKTFFACEICGLPGAPRHGAKAVQGRNYQWAMAGHACGCNGFYAREACFRAGDRSSQRVPWQRLFSQRAGLWSVQEDAGGLAKFHGRPCPNPASQLQWLGSDFWGQCFVLWPWGHHHIFTKFLKLRWPRCRWVWCTPNVYCGCHWVRKEEPRGQVRHENRQVRCQRNCGSHKRDIERKKGVGLRGLVAFGYYGAFVSAFFPSAGGLPVNPCTFATQNWGECVWQQVKPYVEKFVDKKLDETFETLWNVSIEGYQSRLWAINRTAYINSDRYPNGTVKYMSNETRDKMFESLYRVYESMIGEIKLFMTDHAIDTTRGAYLSQFASLHISVMTNLLGSGANLYRTAGDRDVFQTLSACYARNVYDRATEAFKARMSALSATETDHGIHECCSPIGHCAKCPSLSGEFKDTWKDECDWKNSGYKSFCVVGMCVTTPSLRSRKFSRRCYDNHFKEVEKQTALFWRSWLDPIPVWLNNIVLMEGIIVGNEDRPRKFSLIAGHFRIADGQV